MKLRLKHLAPYLPYGLEIMNYNGEAKPIVKKLESLRTFTGALAHPKSKPILRPLIDLTKDKNFIDFCDEEIICGSWRFKYDEILINIETTEKNVFLLVNSGEVADECPLLFYNWLLQNHYDIFGLIEKGLAIDINSLTDATVS